MPGDQVSYNEPIVAPEIETSVEEPTADVIPDPIDTAESEPEAPVEPVTPPVSDDVSGSVEPPTTPDVPSAAPVVEPMQPVQPEKKVGFFARLFGKKS